MVALLNITEDITDNYRVDVSSNDVTIGNIKTAFDKIKKGNNFITPNRIKETSVPA